MFIIILTYTKPLTEIDKHLADHRRYLDECYAKNYLIFSGPQQPRVGGIMVSQLKDRQQLEEVLAKDPFHQFDLAAYQIVEFEAVKFHSQAAHFVNDND